MNPFEEMMSDPGYWEWRLADALEEVELCRQNLERIKNKEAEERAEHWDNQPGDPF